MIKIIPATIQHIPIIQALSNEVWPVTFANILTEQQIAYMMDMMYNTQSLTRQMKEDNHKYILAKEKSNYLGYLAYETNIDDKYTKIHKIYVLPSAQGKGVGKLLIDYAKQMTNAIGNDTLRLNVNRFNTAIQFYQKMGFSIERSEDIDIGNGFLMEDYVMMMQLC